MRVIIIEDEIAAYANLKNILFQIDSQIEILANLDTVTSAVNWLKSNPSPDIIFMDVQLADGLAFNIFDCVDVKVPIIFTTAYDEYAINAFSFNSIDYILKPITKEPVVKALEKWNGLTTKPDTTQALHDLASSFFKDRKPQNILIQVKDKLIPVKLNSISFFYNTEGVTEVSLISGETYKIDRSLDSIFSNLDKNLFYRANRQFIIAREFIKEITIWFDNRLLITLNTETPETILLSKNRAAEFKKWISLF